MLFAVGRNARRVRRRAAARDRSAPRPSGCAARRRGRRRDTRSAWRGRVAGSPPCRRATSSVTESRMLRLLAQAREPDLADRCCRCRRTAARTPRAGCSPSAAACSRCARRSCWCRRTRSRRRTRPAVSLDSIASSSDASCVCLPRLAARGSDPSRSPASSHVSLVGGDTSVRNRVLAFACGAAGPPRRRHAVEAAQHEQLIAERRQRPQRRRQLEAGALRLRGS